MRRDTPRNCSQSLRRRPSSRREAPGHRQRSAPFAARYRVSCTNLRQDRRLPNVRAVPPVGHPTVNCGHWCREKMRADSGDQTSSSKPPPRNNELWPQGRTQAWMPRLADTVRVGETDLRFAAPRRKKHGASPCKGPSSGARKEYAGDETAVLNLFCIAPRSDSGRRSAWLGEKTRGRRARGVRKAGPGGARRPPRPVPGPQRRVAVRVPRRQKPWKQRS
jgi:hypothetical protein